jgi:hypothetical protein
MLLSPVRPLVALGCVALLNVAVHLPSPASASAGCAVQPVSPGTNPALLAISGDGEHIAFTSGEDPLGTNPDGSDEVFRFDVVRQRLEQLTELPADASIPPQSLDVDHDGGTVVFATEADPVGSNVDGNLEVFVHTDQVPVPLPIVVQVTTSTGGEGSGSSASVDADGSRIAFTSDRNLDSTNADANGEVFVVDHDVLGSTVEQITTTTGDGSDAHTQVDLAADGEHVAYLSTRNSTGGNADGNREVFRSVVATEIAAQLTSTTSGFTGAPSISADGNRVVFESTSAELGTNADGNSEVFLRRITPGSTTRITDSPDDSSWPGISGDGQVIGFQTGDVVIRHLVADGTQLTVASAVAGDKLAVAHLDEDGDRMALEQEASVGEEVVLGLCLDPTFTDVGLTHPFVLPIEWMAERGISTGFPDGTYQPSAPVSRQAMSAFLSRLGGGPDFKVPPPQTFSDVSPSHPFFLEVAWMVDEGITTGFPDGTYRPATPVSRQSMSAFLNRLVGSPAASETRPLFSDVSANHPFFAEIQWMAESGVSTGFPDGTFRPSAPVSRQAMSAFLQRLLALDLE